MVLACLCLLERLKSEMMKKTKRKLIGRHALILLVLTLFVLFLSVTGIHCPIRYLLGIPCPTCGTTRAYIAFFHGDFLRAFYYHPLFLLGPSLIFLGIHAKAPFLSRIPQKLILTILCVGSALFLIVYIVRLVWFQIP